MYMIREIAHCRPGKVKDLVTRFKKLGEAMVSRGLPPVRIYTDVSGEQFWTIVMEQDIESLDRHVEMTRSLWTDKELTKIMEGYHELIVDGKREVYKVE